jgi:hypothetical protein
MFSSRLMIIHIYLALSSLPCKDLLMSSEEGAFRVDWQRRFIQMSKVDDDVARSYNRFYRDGHGPRRIMMLLEPLLTNDHQRHVQRFVWRYVPSNARASRLAQDLDRTAEEITRFWLSTYAFVLPYSTEALKHVEELKLHAQTLRNFDWHKTSSMLSYKKFWAHFPLAIACRGLHIPERRSYADLSVLLCAAFKAKGSKPCRSISARALEKSHKRFLKAYSLNPFRINLLNAHLDILLSCVPS